MSSPKTKSPRSPRPKAPAEPSPEGPGLALRGLTLDDHAGLERATERRKAMVGGYVSKNTAALSLLRAAIAAEDAAYAAKEGSR